MKAHLLHLARAAALVPLGLAQGCSDRTLPPLGQLVIHVDTNAPLALEPGQAQPEEAVLPLFDTLRIELLTTGGASACATGGCVQTFAVDRGMLTRRAISFGVVQGKAPVAYVRGRLFRGFEATGDQIPPDVAIDRVMSVPGIGRPGRRRPP